MTFRGEGVRLRVKLDLTGAAGEAEGMMVGRVVSGWSLGVGVGGVGSEGAAGVVGKVACWGVEGRSPMHLPRATRTMSPRKRGLALANVVIRKGSIELVYRTPDPDQPEGQGAAGGGGECGNG